MLPIAIPQRTTRRAAPRADRRVRAWSASVAGGRAVEYRARAARAPAAAGSTTCRASPRRCASAAIALGGFDAADRVGRAARRRAVVERRARGRAAARAARRRSRSTLDDVDARAHRRSAPRTTSSARRSASWTRWRRAWPTSDAALFLDTRTLAYRARAAAARRRAGRDRLGRHARARRRRLPRRAARECEEAARLLGVAQLRDVDRGDLPRVDALPPPLDRRARHVVTENERVLRGASTRCAPAMLRRLGALFDASHASMRDDFEVSMPEIDRLVDVCSARRPSVFGARLTGGGFGGCDRRARRRRSRAAAAARDRRATTATRLVRGAACSCLIAIDRRHGILDSRRLRRCTMDHRLLFRICGGTSCFSGRSIC